MTSGDPWCPPGRRRDRRGSAAGAGRWRCSRGSARGWPAARVWTAKTSIRVAKPPLWLIIAPSAGLAVVKAQRSGRMPNKTFLTTHTGSLPRPADLTPLLQSREDGTPTPDLDQRVAEAVRETVRQQVEAGVDVVNDGEMGKIGYSTYVTGRLTGFDRAAERATPRRRSTWPSFPTCRTIAARCHPPSAMRTRPRAPATSSQRHPGGAGGHRRSAKRAAAGGAVPSSCS